MSLGLRLLLLPLFVSNEAFAFELTETATGAELRWDPPAFSYGAAFTPGDLDSERFAAACRAAADGWMLASGLGVTATWNGPHSIAAGDDENTIAVVNPWDPSFGDPARSVAHTELRYQVESGRMLEADIYLNGESFQFGGEGGFDSESVVLHELGHLLGIAHSCGDPGRTFPSCFSVPESERVRILEAVMAPTLAPGVERRVPNADDLAALEVHYRGTATGDVPLPLSVTRECPSGALLADPIGFEATLRHSGGTTAPLASGFREGEGADLVLRDPDSGLFGVRYLVDRPADCIETPPEPGCGCQAHRQADPIGAILLFGLAIWRRALRSLWRS